MKNYLFIASAAMLVLVGCSKDAIDAPKYNGIDIDLESEIAYNTYTGKQSKVGVVSYDTVDNVVVVKGTAFPKSYEEVTLAGGHKAPRYYVNYYANKNKVQFGSIVYYLQSNAGNWASAWDKSTEYINESTIQYDQTINTFRHPSKKFYWPKSGNLSFFSYFPNNLQSLASDFKIDSSYNFTYQVTDGDVDILLAKPQMNITQNASPAGVPTVFQHKLTKIGVVARLKEAYDPETEAKFHINDIKFVNVYNTADFVGTPNTLGDAWVISDSTDYSTVDYMANTDTVLAQFDTLYRAMRYDEMILMPQDFKNNTNPYKNTTDSAHLYVKYVIEMPGTTVPVLDTCEVRIPLEGEFFAGNTTEWGINKYVVYRITFGLDEILWDPSTDDWDDPKYDDIEIKY
ncbi:MAG: fimbrillin family protein [Bacteroidaceae bacterium]|nr:fimbrillin family protein [Bacteroidaceae bacterium]